jgi:hypothetical protein
MKSVELIKITDWRDRFAHKPLAIVGPGPSYDLVPEAMWRQFEHVFALNATITKCWNHPGHVWVSNDHDRTFKSQQIMKGLKSTLDKYKKWNTTANRKFLPGAFGRKVPWVDRHGVVRHGDPWNLKAPVGSSVYWYETVEGRDGYVRNGHTVLELALEIATIWGFDPIILIGVDLVMIRGKSVIERPLGRDIKDAIYYAKPWRWKDIPKRMFRDKIVEQRHSVTSNAPRWSGRDIYTLSPYWSGPFSRIDLKALRDLTTSPSFSPTKSHP